MKSFPFEQTNLFQPFRLGRTARDTLQEFMDIDVSTGDLVRILNANQAYKDLFFRFVSKKTAKLDGFKDASQGDKKTEAPANANNPKDPGKNQKPSEPTSPTHRLISLLGMLGSRNLIIALRFYKLIHGKFPINEAGEIDLPVTDHLKMALEAEELFHSNKLEYSETAYAAGAYYDLCVQVYEKMAGQNKLEDYYKRVWQRALRTGVVAGLLANEIPGVLPRMAIGAGMLSHAGKLHMAASYSSSNYADFEEQLDKNQALPPLARMHLEKQKFGTNQEEVGAYTLRYFDVFQNLIPIIENFREPYVLRGVDKQAHNLCVVVNLADSMARSWKIPIDEKDPIFSEWSYPAQIKLKIKKSSMIAVMKKSLTLSK